MTSQKRLYIILSILSLIITGIILFNFLNQFESEKNYKQIIVASRNIDEPKIIEENDLAYKSVPESIINDFVFYKKEELIGQTLTKTLTKNSIIYKNDIYLKLDPESISTKIDKNKKAFVIDATWFDATIEAKTNDYVDIAVAKKNVKLDDNSFLIKHAKILKISQNQNGSKDIIVELSDTEIIALIYARSNEFKLHLIIDPINK